MPSPATKTPVTQAVRGAPYREIVAHYESCLRVHGDHHRGVDWPNREDARTRYRVMLDVIRSPGQRPARLLDLGCGAAHLYEYIRESDRRDIDYTGLDLSEAFVKLSRAKHPDRTFHCLDLLDPAAELPAFDYVVLNGVLTEKRSMPFDAMWEYAQALLARAYQIAAVGMAFNLMSRQVDWEREDLFHVPLDLLADFLARNLSRHFVIRNDYGLYEYTAYVYRNRCEPADEPSRSSG